MFLFSVDRICLFVFFDFLLFKFESEHSYRFLTNGMGALPAAKDPTTWHYEVVEEDEAVVTTVKGALGGCCT